MWRVADCWTMRVDDDEVLEDAPPHRRLHTVRTRLLAMDYNEPLGVESIDLVERMLLDLITTSESYEKLQQQVDRLSQDLALAQARVMPLRKAISRLTRENNQLHAKMIDKAEKDDERDNVHRREIGTLQGQLDDARFLSAQKDIKLAEQSRRLDELGAELARVLHDQPARNGALNQPNMEFTAELPLPPISPGVDSQDASLLSSPFRVGASRGGADVDEEARGLLLVLEKKVAELQALSTTLQEEKVALEGKLHSREEEVKRVSQMLEDDYAEGKGAERLAAQSARAANERIVEQLNSQVDFLNSQLASREAQMARLVNEEVVSGREARRVLQKQVSQLQSENAELHAEVRRAEEKALQAKATATRRSSVTPSRHPPTDAATGGGGAHVPPPVSSAEHKALQKRVQELEGALGAAQAELGRRDGLVAELRRELEEALAKSTAHGDAERLKAELASVQARLSDRDSQLSSLLVEKEDLLHMLEDANHNAERNETVIKVLRSDEAKLKVELASLRRSIRESAHEGRTAAEDAQAAQELREDATQALLQEWEARFSAEQEARGVAEEEVHKTKAELQQAKDEVARLGRSLMEARLAGGQATGDEGREAQRRRQAEDHLQHAIVQHTVLEGRVEELAKVAAEAGTQVEALRSANLQARQEAQALRAQAEQHEHEASELRHSLQRVQEENAGLREAGGEAGAALFSRRRAEEEKDREIRRLSEEIQRLQATYLSLSRRGNEGHERVCELEEQVTALAAELRNSKERERLLSGECERASKALALAEGERNDLRLETQRSSREVVREKDMYQDTLAKLNQARAEVLQKEEQISQLKSLFAQLHAGREQLNAKLHKAYAELSAWEDKERDAAQQHQQLDDRLQEKQEEIDRLKRVLSQLDEERDSLQASLDEQQEANVTLQREQQAYERALRRIEADKQDEQQRCKVANAALAAKEKEARLLQQQLASLQQEAAEGRKALHSRMLELRAVNEDLHMMTRENQVTNGELATLMREREGLLAKLDGALARSSKAEQLLRVAHVEKDDLMAAYRAAVDERKRLEAGADELSKSRQRLSNSLEQAHRELAQSNSSVMALESELQRKSADVAAFERQVESLSRKLAAAQRRLDADDDEMRRLANELHSQRSAIGSNASAVKSLEARAASSSEEGAMLRARLADMTRERDSLLRMLGEERSHVTELERIIEAARAREAVHTTQSTDLMRQNLQLREALRRAGQPLPSTPVSREGGGGGGDVSATSSPSSAFAGRQPPTQAPRGAPSGGARHGGARRGLESKYSPPSSAIPSSSSSSGGDDDAQGEKTDHSDLLEEGYLEAEAEAGEDDR